jgi:hypothetical protein
MAKRLMAVMMIARSLMELTPPRDQMPRSFATVLAVGEPDDRRRVGAFRDRG